MKSLYESLFDIEDNVSSEVPIGDLYQLSDVPHHNMISNDMWELRKLFDKKVLDKYQAIARADKYGIKNNGFVQYFKIDDIINIILDCPASYFTKEEQDFKWNRKSKFFKYIDGFLSKHPTGLFAYYVIVDSKMINIYIRDDAFKSRPNSLKITLVKK